MHYYYHYHLFSRCPPIDSQRVTPNGDDIHTHTPARKSSTSSQLYYFVIQMCSANWLGHGHGYKWHSSQTLLPQRRGRWMEGLICSILLYTIICVYIYIYIYILKRGPNNSSEMQSRQKHNTRNDETSIFPKISRKRDKPRTIATCRLNKLAILYMFACFVEHKHTRK